jgi:sucrose phosphorylase
VDVNVQDPAMFVRLTRVLLNYALYGASSIRLDAVGFLWKESHTSCLNLVQTHTIIKIWHLLLNYFAPNSQIITETNVPHQQNVGYFGQGDEAHQVYQFALPPLVLYSFTVGNSTKLSNWANGINKVSHNQTYFNFLASHDGIGMRPMEGILTEAEKALLADKTLNNGGRLSYKQNSDGNQSVYELNISYFDALRNKTESDELAVQKMLAAHHIMFSLVGVPAIYYHSLFGSQNDYAGLESSLINRRINREKLETKRLTQELEENPIRRAIFSGIKQMLTLRSNQELFSPYTEQKVIYLGQAIFALERRGPKGKILAVTNVSPNPITLEGIKGYNLITDQELLGSLTLAGYGRAWVVR